jgi:hypothetical protein
MKKPNFFWGWGGMEYRFPDPSISKTNKARGLDILIDCLFCSDLLPGRGVSHRARGRWRVHRGVRDLASQGTGFHSPRRPPSSVRHEEEIEEGYTVFSVLSTVKIQVFLFYRRYISIVYNILYNILYNIQYNSFFWYKNNWSSTGTCFCFSLLI